jgi:hypothetical protein
LIMKDGSVYWKKGNIKDYRLFTSVYYLYNDVCFFIS